MPTFFFADLVRELCQDGGTGPLMPTGAVPGHRRFSGIVPVGDPFHYAIAGIAQPAQWEVGIGRIDGAGRLQRDSVAASSNAGDRVDFAPGLKTIALTVGAEWFAAHDAEGSELAEALAAKQPLSTTHPAATAGAADDRVTVRRGEGWVNIPLSTLAFRASDGRYALDGPLGAQNGGAAVPAISFAADPDTGLFRAAADAIGIATDGVERLRLSPSGQLGIGTNAPTVRLHVEAGGAGDVARFGVASGQSLYLYADAGFTGLFNVAGAGAGRDGIRIGGDFVALDTGATERVRVDGAGNVGIGTASPGNSGGFNRQLHIQGDYPCLTLGGNVAARSYSLGVNGGGDFAIWDNQAAASSMQIAAGTGAVTFRGSLLQLGVLGGPLATPTRISLDTSYANSPAPTNQQLKLNLVPVSGTEAYGWTVDNLGRLWHYSGNSVGPTGGHIFATGNAARWQLVTAGHFQPVSDNVHSLGGAGNRTTVVYAATGTINTSDAREKTWRGAANAAEMRAGRRIVAELGFLSMERCDRCEGRGQCALSFRRPGAARVGDHGRRKPDRPDRCRGTARCDTLCLFVLGRMGGGRRSGRPFRHSPRPAAVVPDRGAGGAARRAGGGGVIGGSALSSRAVGDTAPRDLASEWGGPEPSAPRGTVPIAREPGRRVKPRKP